MSEETQSKLKQGEFLKQKLAEGKTFEQAEKEWYEYSGTKEKTEDKQQQIAMNIYTKIKMNMQKFYKINYLTLTVIILLLVNCIFMAYKSQSFYNWVYPKVNYAKIIQADIRSKNDYLIEKYKATSIYKEKINKNSNTLNKLNDDVYKLEKYLDNNILYPVWR